MIEICHYERCRWRTPDGHRTICTCAGCMEPDRRDEAHNRYIDNQRKTRIVHKRERMRRLAEGEQDDQKRAVTVILAKQRDQN